MNDEQLVKKKSKRKPTLDPGGKTSKTTFPILARIVLKCGSVVEIPELPMNISGLTTYDHMRIALEHAALATYSLERLGSGLTPTLAMSHNLAPIRLNLEDLKNHLYYAIELYEKEKESS
jgi:hypothetical protein